MLNMDMTQPLLIHNADQPWLPSPMAGVLRQPLERAAAESGHTTSIVSYAAGASFSSHPHPQGEEILVLSGVFSDESGDYPAGTYLRNPPGSEHAPFSHEGCEIFVKLNQFDPHDSDVVRIAAWQDAPILSRQVQELHTSAIETVNLVRLPAGEEFLLDIIGQRVEVLVIAGALESSGQRWVARDWLRIPKSQSVLRVTASTASLLFIKQWL